MPEWIPLQSSARGRLTLVALDRFATSAYDDVSVADIARAAGVTTGSLYHHFGSKLGLYAFVRRDVERRLLDRLRGAVAARADDPPGTATMAALTIAFDFLVEEGWTRLVALDHPELAEDPIRRFLGSLIDRDGLPLGEIVAAAWRAALVATLDGVPAGRARAALGSFHLDDA